MLGAAPCLLSAATVFSQQSFSTYANSDFNDYKKSPFANALWDPFVKEGFEALDRTDLQSSIEFLRKAANSGCKSPLVFFKLALAYEAQGSYYSAIQYYELARESFKQANPDHRYAKQLDENYGRALYLMGKTEKALPILENAAKGSSTPWILNLLGQIYLNQGDALKATVYYERLFQMKDSGLKKNEVLNIYLQLARSYRNKGEKTQAEKYYKKILELDPSHGEAKEYIIQRKPSDINLDQLFERLN